MQPLRIGKADSAYAEVPCGTGTRVNKTMKSQGRQT